LINIEIIISSYEEKLARMSKIVFLFLKTLFLKKAVESPILLKVAQHFFNEMNIVIKFQVRIPLKNTSFDFNEKTQKAKNISGFIQVRT